MLNSKKYVAGSLSYSLGGLIGLFAWLLWGDFCFSLMETVMPQLLPLTLKDQGASNVLIGVIVGSLPGLMNILINPVISTASDRHRGRFGRRIPFLFWPTPFIAIFLVMIGFSPDIARWLHGILSQWVHLAPFYVVMAVICISLVAFQFFNLFVASIYYYLWADVVPSEFLGRFMALFRVVGAMAGFVWGRYIFGLAETHLREIYIGIAAFYLVAFWLMCWKVKEGDYPPPPPRTEKFRLRRAVKVYFRECFSLPFYVWFFVLSACFMAAQSSNLFVVFFVRENLHLTLADLGRINSWCNLISIPMLLGFGVLTDKIHPMRMTIIGAAVSFVVAAGSFFGIQGYNSLLVFAILNTFSFLCYAVGQVPLCAVLFPKEQYGQFCSAQAIICSLGMILGNFGAGQVIDWIHDYRFLFAWRAVFWGLALVPLIFVFKDWLRYGGVKNYIPPTFKSAGSGL
jgi:maltose/moltooligosaccharide transporter